MKDDKVVNLIFKISEVSLRKLEYISLANGCTKSVMIEQFIDDAWNKMHKNDEFLYQQCTNNVGTLF